MKKVSACSFVPCVCLVWRQVLENRTMAKVHLTKSEGSVAYSSYLLSTYYMPDPMLSTRNTMRTKRTTVPILTECIVFRRDQKN